MTRFAASTPSTRRARASGGHPSFRIDASSGATRSSVCSTSRASSPSARCTNGLRRSSVTSRNTLLCAQFRNMVRTERTKAREKKKYDAITIEPYTDEAIAEIEACVRKRVPPRRGTPMVRGRSGGRRDRPDGEGTAHRHRHDLLARRHGHGPVRRAAAPVGVREPAADPAVLPSRRPQRARCDATGALGSRFRSPIRQPDDVRLRPHARDVAHPSVHGLDGRRRLAVEARLRVPPVQLRGRHPMAARAR